MTLKPPLSYLLKKLNKGDILIFEQVAGDAFEKLGYKKYFADENERSFTKNGMRLLRK